MSDNEQPGKMKKWILSTLSGLTANIILALIVYIVGVYNIIPVINKTKTTLDSVNNAVTKIKNNYVVKDRDGIEVKVGINSELEGNSVAVYRDNVLRLKFTNAFLLTNPIDGNNFHPTIKLLVTTEVEKKNDKSTAEIFISKDAALRLGLFKSIDKGIFILKLRMIEKDELFQQ